MNSIGAAAGKIDKIYSNKPRLFNVGGNKQSYATQPMMQWPSTNQYQSQPINQQQTQYGSQFPQMMQQQQQQQYHQQANQATWGGVAQGYDMSSANGMQFQQQQNQNQTYQQQLQQVDQQLFNNNPNQSNDQNTQKLSNFGQNKFDMRRMPPPPPPPPEMIQALMALTQNMQFNAGNQAGFAPQPPQSSSFMPPPDYYRSGYEGMNTNANALPTRTSGQRLKLTSHVYKNQNASSAPLNPKFFKAGEKTQKVEKEKLYKPNTGYTIEEEETEKKEAVNAHQPINIVIRGQDDLINSGVTTEMDEDDDDGQLAMLNPADRNYVQSKFLISESITESQFKEELPKLYIDPKHAVTIEEQKILEKEKEEEEFQKKKEVFLVKSKYKILAEMEKEKSKKLMEKLLKKELDTVEARNREQELTLKIEGEQILKQKEQARDLEMIIKDIREERDYKMINKVLGINLEKPLDEIVDLEKIKADYAVEAMYKRNEELYEETNRLLRECDFYVDIDGRSYNTYHQKPIGEKNRSMARALIGMKESDDDSEDGENSQVYTNSHVKYSGSMGSSSKQVNAAAGANMKNSGGGGNHSRVRFGNNNNNSSKIPEAEEDEETQQKVQKQREFYANIQREVNNAQMKLDEMCESMHESQVEEDFEFSVNSIRRPVIPSSQKSIPSSQNQSVNKTLPKQQVQSRQNSLNSKSKNSQPNSKNSTIKKR